MKKIIVVGGGAAGLMAAYSAAKHGGTVILIEKMDKIGKKILITGKGRCNVSNIADVREFIQAMPGNGSFLYGALNQFGSQDLCNLLRIYGLETKVERGGRIFPLSDHAGDVVKTLHKMLAEQKVEICYRRTVEDIVVDKNTNQATGVKLSDQTIIEGDAIILTTGGSSYPGTGSTGDGYRMAKRLGHQVVPLQPCLIPLTVEEEWVKDLQGLSLRNVRASIICDGKKVAEEFGEMLFTHYGVSGPIILSLSHEMLTAQVENKKCDCTMQINLKPALLPEELDRRLQRDFTKFSRKQFKNALQELLPSSLIPVIIDLSFIDPDKFVNQISRIERLRLVEILQRFTLTITGTRPLAEAIVTAGGVNVKEINPSSMESKLINALFFAGEVIDIHGFTGGYNLQAAFSTGYVAGVHAALN